MASDINSLLRHIPGDWDLYLTSNNKTTLNNPKNQQKTHKKTPITTIKNKNNKTKQKQQQTTNTMHITSDKL